MVIQMGGRAVFVFIVYSALTLLSFRYTSIQFIDVLYNVTLASGIICPRSIFNSQPDLYMLFPELKAQASLLSYL